ncbi:MAG: hypothetical protein Q9219_001574 [cf. Caloplaca sp. 3 TL-2023]
MAATRSQNNAQTIFDAFNNAFLIQSGSDVFYKKALNDSARDAGWTASLNILAAQDAYECTGDPDKKILVNKLLTTWLKYNPTPWDWDGWNDDLGWFTLALVRGYQMTGTQSFLDAAKYGFDYTFGRGWETQHNGGGIWEENPEYRARAKNPSQATKEALSNDSLGKVACILYQSTHDRKYLDRSKQIYTWVRANLYNSSTGQINTGIDPSGKLDTTKQAYNQGTFLDFASLLWEITGDTSIYDDAKRAIDFGHDQITTNGVFSNAAGHLATWADEFARGAGHFVRDNRLGSTYHKWFQQNANAIIRNRRVDLGLTWNAWDQPTPNTPGLTANNFASATAWLQFTPVTQPNEIAGIRVITNKKTGMAVDSAGTYDNGANVTQWGQSATLNQRWLLTQNSDSSWNIINLATWEALDCPGGRKDDGLTMIQWRPHRDANQRWMIEKQGDGSFKICNQASGKVLDGGDRRDNGAVVVQGAWNGEEGQRWAFK